MNYRLDVYDADGDLQAMVADFTWLTASKGVNVPGEIVFGLAADHALMSTIAHGWQVELWRETNMRPFSTAPITSTWTRELVGDVDVIEYVFDDNQNKATVHATGIVGRLGWRSVMYPVGHAKSEFVATAAETIAKTLVSYNIGSSATTANGRAVSGVMADLTVEADGVDGTELDWFCAYENLLTTLQDLALAGGGDFDLERTDGGYEFVWHDGQLGTDRTATVIFELGRGNMEAPLFRSDITGLVTSVVVGGPGEEAERMIHDEQSSDYAAGSNFEAFVDATDVDTDDGLGVRGVAFLDDHKAANTFSFDVLQTPSMMYGVQYFLGDLVSAINPFDGSEIVCKVTEVMLELGSDCEEKIEVRVE